MADFKTAYALTFKNEGGYANVEGDNGGETYCGITRKNFPAWEGWHIIGNYQPLRNGQLINNTELFFLVDEFYKENFWDKLGLDQMADQDLANQVFDMAVNAGVGEALKLLRQSE